MRLMKSLTTSAIVLSMTTTPVLASQGSASSLSISNSVQKDVASSPSTSKGVRVSTKAGKANKLAPAVIIGVLATVALIGGAIILANNDDDPDSP